MESQETFDMQKPKKFWGDEQMRDVMGTLLRAGVLTAAFFVVLGGLLFFIQHPKEIFDYTLFKGEPERLRKVHTIVKEALNFRGRAVIQFGLLLLIATPVARVIFSFVGFFFEKDWVYVVITIFVLIILVASLLSNYFAF
jgi:uncharacterized membrane protein